MKRITGGGGFGDVYWGVLQDGSHVGLKCLRLHSVSSNSDGKKFLKRAAHELYVWSKCNHANVLDLIGVAQYGGQILMVSPWIQTGNLLWFISHNKEVNRCSLGTQIASGVAYLHKREIVHGDIKGANVLVTADHTIKLADFGSATLRDYTLQFTATTSGGGMSIRWTAPEVIKADSKATAQADVYALGMTIFV
ncbi:putative serine/threonine-protein kinase DDB_G0275165 [Rhizoctonia solani AG-1 IB]|uniref:Putative serine/threonine-protein kinase DDB_G0275165 n=1 Tax=Thanatephorus cucumeris (strain AG1-IB / isolate 7/3/14) TaxID=1108050 RepID=M5C7F3_THACB|nr:putative serine/threonine-protein kinase DDB_G0275165 [Rhizoctonia solani AG-1 IB]